MLQSYNNPYFPPKLVPPYHIKPEELEKKLSIANFKTIEVKGLEFNPFNKKWRKSENLSVNYIICSSKI